MYNLLKKTAGSAFVYSLGNLSTKLVGFILIPFYTEYIPLDEYGVLGMLEATSMAIISIFGLNLYYSFIRWYYDKEEESRRGILFYTSTIFLFVFTFFISLPLLFLAKDISTLIFDKPDYYLLIDLMILSSVIQIISTMPSTLLRLQEKPQMYVITNAVRLVVILLLTIYFLVYLKLGLKSIFIAQVAGNIVYMGTLLRYSLKNFTVYFDFKSLKEMLRYGLPMIYASLSGISISLADKYILGISTGLANSGIYSFGFKIANTVYYFVIESANLALGPVVFSLMNSENNKRFYSKIMTYMSLIVLIIIMIISVFSKEIILFLARKTEYYDSYKIIPIIAFSAVFMMMRDNTMRALNIVKKPTIISIVVVIVSVFNFLLNVFLIPKFGVYGASFTFLLTQVLNFYLIYYFSQKYYFIPYEKGKLSLMIFLSIAIIGLGMFCFSEITWINLIIKLVLIAIFPVILYFFNFYERVELQKIKKLILRKN